MNLHRHLEEIIIKAVQLISGHEATKETKDISKVKDIIQIKQKRYVYYVQRAKW